MLWLAALFALFLFSFYVAFAMARGSYTPWRHDDRSS
jgi:hypothetical protein